MTTPEPTRASDLQIDIVALNPQPLPPEDGGPTIHFVALNLQPLPPRPPTAG